MRLTQCDAGLMVVEHQAGYAFVFQRHDEAGIDLVDCHWEGVGPAPDTRGLEEEAKRFAERQAQAAN